MNTDRLAALAARAVAVALGDDATYLPLIGAVRTVRVFQRRPQQVIDGLGMTRLLNDGCIIEIERALLSADPQPGDKLTIGAHTLLVRSVHQIGASAVVWALDCVP